MNTCRFNVLDNFLTLSQSVLICVEILTTVYVLQSNGNKAIIFESNGIPKLCMINSIKSLKVQTEKLILKQWEKKKLIKIGGEADSPIRQDKYLTI